MAQQLLSSFGKQGSNLGLDRITVDIEDTKQSSKYFDVTEFNPIFTAGKNSVSFNGSSFLAPNSEIRIECLDNEGNSLYVEIPTQSANYKDVGKFTVSVSVFAETFNGPGLFILVGTYFDGRTVRWKANITINNGLANVSRTRFYNTPALEVRSLLFPVVNSGTGSLLTETINVNPPGKFSGNPVNPQLGTSVAAETDISQTDYRITGDPVFTSQMVGGNVIVMASLIVINLVWYGFGDGTGEETVNITESFKIKSVINSTTIQIDKPFSYDPSWVNYVGQNFTAGTTIAQIVNCNLAISYIETEEVSSIIPIMADNCTGQTPDPLATVYPANQPVPVTNNYTIISLHNSFSQSMVGKTININSSQIIISQGSGTQYVNYAGQHSAKIVQLSPPPYVGNNNVVSIDVPFTYPVSGSLILANINVGTFTVTDQPPNIFQNYTASNGTGSLVQKSYAEIVYRNIKTFSGFVSRHKLYAKSNIYPGDYVIVADSQIGPFELLTDPTTPDKSYSKIGSFLTRDQVGRYWFANNTASISVIQADSPVISSLYISAQPGQPYPDGTDYVICKTTAAGLQNDSVYYPYDETQFSDFSGSSYASNFISLKANTFYELSTNVALQKDTNTQNAKVSLYFTSSNPTITKEINYRRGYGLLLGEISISGRASYQLYSDSKTFPFTPLDDYYGTLVIVPYQCNVILSNLSLKNYGDYGFSPDTGYIRIPFPINVANEAFTLKSELYDINSNLVYSTAPVVQTFDQYGMSLYGSSILGTTGTGTIPTTVPTLTVTGNFLLPDAPTCGTNTSNRVLGIDLSTGIVCATNIVGLSLVSSPSTNTYKDYIELDMANPTATGRSLVIHYNGVASEGKRIVILANGSKTIYS